MDKRLKLYPKGLSLTAENPCLPQAVPRVALITGGVKRIGRAIAETLAQAGFDIALHCHRSRAEADALCAQLREFGVRACVVQADLNDVAQTQTILAQASEQLGTVGVLVNNASLFEYDALTQGAPLNADLFARHWRTNTYAPLLLTQQFAQQLPKSGQNAHGVVINLLDQKLYNPNPDFLSYTLSKAALKEATTLAALALAPRVRVVGIAPGLTLPSGEQSAAQFQLVHSQTPLQRGSTPQDIADAVLFAVRNHALTGTVLQIDGGQHLAPSSRDVMFLGNETPQPRFFES